MTLKRTAIAFSTVALATLLSLSCSEQLGISLSVGSAEAKTVRPSTSASAAGVVRRQYPRGAYARAAAADFYCARGVGCGYGADTYYNSYVQPGFPPSFYGVYGGYSDGFYGRYVNSGYYGGW